MEKTGSMVLKDNNSQKLLYKYQFAFLNMQKSFTSLIKILKGFVNRKQCKSILIWKSKTTPSYLEIRPKLLIFKSNLVVSESKFKKNVKFRLFQYFFQIITISNIKKHHLALQKQFEIQKIENQNELETMTSEVKNLKSNQVELEIISNYYAKNETNLRQKIRKLSGKNSIEKIKKENFELQLQIEEMDTKIVMLFQELNLMLDNYENNKKGAKGKKSKKRGSIVQRKSNLPIFRVD